MKKFIDKTLNEALEDRKWLLADLFCELCTRGSKISYASLVSYQQGKRVPRHDRLVEIADVLDTSTDRLLSSGKAKGAAR